MSASTSVRTGTRAGVLRPDELARYVRRGHLEPDASVAPWVEAYWSVRWALPPGVTYVSRVISHPAVHVTVESGAGPRHGVAMPAALVHGVVTRAFEIELSGQGRVFGVRFRPGGFGALTGRPVAELTDRVRPLADVVRPSAPSADVPPADTLLASVLAAAGDEGRRDVVQPWLEGLRPAPDPAYDALVEVVALMLSDRSLTTVDQVVARCDVPLRTLQRLFRRYVGVGPKWVLRRFRLHDAVTSLDAGEPVDLGRLAVDLGWYDQAHLTREFTELVGVPPAAYAARFDRGQRAKVT